MFLPLVTLALAGLLGNFGSARPPRFPQDNCDWQAAWKKPYFKVICHTPSELGRQKSKLKFPLAVHHEKHDAGRSGRRDADEPFQHGGGIPTAAMLAQGGGAGTLREAEAA